MQYFAYSQKAFVYKYVVMLSDSDQFKHMSFANYLKLMFLATDALFIPLHNAHFLEKYSLRISDSRMQFKKQSKPGDSILINVNSSNINHNSLSLLYTFIIEGSGELVGLGRQTLLFQITEDGTAGDLNSIPGLEVLIRPIEVNEDALVYKY